MMCVFVMQSDSDDEGSRHRSKKKKKNRSDSRSSDSGLSFYLGMLQQWATNLKVAVRSWNLVFGQYFIGLPYFI
jgi:hypothetical protein